MKPTPVTSVALEVPVQSDVLLQLLDQQIPQPDRLHALCWFAAHQSAFALAGTPPQPIRCRCRILSCRRGKLAVCGRIINLFQARKRCSFPSTCCRRRNACKQHRDSRDRSPSAICRLPPFDAGSAESITTSAWRDSRACHRTCPVRRKRSLRASSRQPPGVRSLDRESRPMSPIPSWAPVIAADSERAAVIRSCPAADFCEETQSVRGLPRVATDCALASAGCRDPSGDS